MAHTSPARRGFTLIELLVVVAIIAVLVGLLLPAVQKVREAAGRSKCQNNLKQIALAAHGFHDAQQRLPWMIGATITAPGTNPFIEILPYIEQGALKQKFDSDVASAPGSNISQKYNAVTKTGAAAGVYASSVPVPIYTCPSDLFRGSQGDLTADTGGGKIFACLSYCGVRGTKGAPATDHGGSSGVIIWATSPAHALHLTDVADGTSNTLMFSERHHNDPRFDAASPAPTFNLTNVTGLWANVSAGLYQQLGQMDGLTPVNFQMIETADTLLKNAAFSARYQNALGSGHAGGANAALTDGSVRFLPNGTPAQLLFWLATRDGGEVIGDY